MPDPFFAPRTCRKLPRMRNFSEKSFCIRVLACICFFALSRLGRVFPFSETFCTVFPFPSSAAVKYELTVVHDHMEKSDADFGPRGDQASAVPRDQVPRIAHMPPMPEITLYFPPVMHIRRFELARFETDFLASKKALSVTVIRISVGTADDRSL